MLVVHTQCTPVVIQHTRFTKSHKPLWHSVQIKFYELEIKFDSMKWRINCYKDFDWSLMKQNKLWRMKVIEKFEKYFFLQMEYTTQLFVSKNFIDAC